MLNSVHWKRWIVLTGIAVGGSCLYGASLAWLFPQWDYARGAAWLAISAGLSWCLFIPALIRWTQEHWITIVDACLITMAWGEAVLCIGAIINRANIDMAYYWAILLNVGIVAVSNIVMVSVLATRLRRFGFPIWKTLLAWMVVLNGSGVVFFVLFYRWLSGEMR